MFSGQSNNSKGLGANIAGNLLSLGLQGIVNRRAERRQWNRNVSMWKMQNEYNTPSNQMKRLKEAGLNHNIMRYHHKEWEKYLENP
jgi:hypothetical protein